MARILIVDDEDNVLEGILRRMRRTDHEVFTATSAREASGILNKERMDVVVADETMPGMTGTEFLSVVRNRWPWVTRIMFTGTNDLEVATRAVNEAAVDRFLTKPLSVEGLLYTIEDALRRTLLIRQRIALKISW